MNFRKAFISMLAAGAVAVTGVAPASATMNLAKPAVPVAAIPAPIQVRDHIVTGNEVVIRRGHRYWNGHRGHRYFRHGYRRHYDGYWYPGAAFGLGIIIAPQPRRIIRIAATGESMPPESSTSTRPPVPTGSPPAPGSLS